jgi:hypothetical protein
MKNILNFEKMFEIYGFKFIILNNNLILLKTVPKILYTLLVSWNDLFNDMFLFFSKNIGYNLLNINLHIIKIFYKNISHTNPIFLKDFHILEKFLFKINF